MGFPYPYPLGLPKGTVRSTLTILLSIDLFIITLREEPFAEQVASIVLVALAFYFGGRMRSKGTIVPRSPTARADRAWGLPAGTIRTLLILMYSAFGVYLIINGKPIPDYYVEIATIIVGYLIGQMFNKVKVAFRRKRGVKEEHLHKTSLIEHMNAILAITIVSITIYFTIYQDTFKFLDFWINLASIYLGFYYGERN